MYTLIVVGAAAIAMMIVERLGPGRNWPRVKGWWARAIILNGVQVGSVFLAGIAWFHQVHHSPQRIEVITSFYKHPVEIIVNSVLSSAILYMLVGLDTKAASLAILMTGLAELFYHWNVKTPYWLGFIFQRPESHCIHHQEDVHRYNYSDLPLWDMLFGTFKNPKEFTSTCGFGSEREPRLGEMLIGIDVYENTTKE